MTKLWKLIWGGILHPCNSFDYDVLLHLAQEGKSNNKFIGFLMGALDDNILHNLFLHFIVYSAR